jgi:hypothetical protein
MADSILTEVIPEDIFYRVIFVEVEPEDLPYGPGQRMTVEYVMMKDALDGG